MKKLAILGLGKIGSYILQTIDKSQFEVVDGYDKTTGHEFYNDDVLRDIIKNYNGVLACTPFLINKRIANICNELGVDYFDLTESIDVSQHVATLDNALFVPQCGLAPGVVSMIANYIAKEFDKVQDIQIRVGAVPQVANNRLKYLRSWSTEGLINEYCNFCISVKHGSIFWAEPLTEEEKLVIDGTELEAANTSGGIGTLAHTWQGKAESVNYKTLRYPGHFEIMRVLKYELGMKKNFDTFVKLFNDNIPETNNDVVYIVINVNGFKNDILKSNIYKKRIFSSENATAIQIATGNGVMAILDIWSQNLLDGKKGLVKQEELPIESVWNSKYIACYK